MKTRKFGTFAVTAAVLLMAALLVTNCVEPTNTSGLAGLPPAPEGTSYLKFNIVDNISRTVMPTLPTANIDYEVIIQLSGALSGNLLSGGDQFVSATGAHDFALGEGTYRVIVNARTNGDIFATGQSGNTATINHTILSPGSVNISLKELTDGDGDGLFFWNFGSVLPANTDDAELAIYDLVNGAYVSGYAAYDISAEFDNTASGSDDPVSLPSGYYRVSVMLDGANVFGKVHENYVHIYQNMETTWTTTFPALNSNVHSIEFDAGDGVYLTNTDPGTVTGIAHGTTFGVAPDDPDGLSGLSGNLDTFSGWYTAASGGGFVWLFDSDGSTPDGYKVLRSRTLYAHYIDGSSPAANISVTLAAYSLPVDSSPAVTAGGSISSDDIMTNTGVLTRTLTLTNAAGLDNIKWWYGTHEITSSDALEGITIAGNVLTINFATIRELNGAGIFNDLTGSGTHYINVYATTGDGSANDPYVYWAARIAITVTDN